MSVVAPILVTYFAIIGRPLRHRQFLFRFKRQEQALVTTVRALALLKPLNESDEPLIHNTDDLR